MINAATGDVVGSNLVEFEVFSDYNPLPPPAAKDAARKKEEAEPRAAHLPRKTAKPASPKVAPPARPIQPAPIRSVK